MSNASRLRHSFAGRCVRQGIHTWFRLQHRSGKPVRYRLPLGVEIQLYPEGEIAEFLTVQTFFEQTELALVASYLKPGMKVVDVGANIGLYSVFAQKLLGAAGRIWAFEPSIESFRRLKRNLLLNDCRLVEALPIALADTPGASLELKSDRGFGDAYRYLKPASDPEFRSDSEAELVPVTTLDQWASENKTSPLDFLKVDIEGGEYRMFSGAQEVIRSSPDVVIVFESDPEWCRRAGCTQADTYGLLERLGLGLYGWNKASRDWQTGDAFLLNANMIWASYDRKRLPRV